MTHRPDAPTPRLTSREAAEVLVDELLAAMDGLIEVMETETALVRQGRLAAAGTLGKEKRERAAHYTQLALAAKGAMEDIGRLAPVAASEMRRRHELFRAEAQINLAVLTTARQVAEDLVRGVAEQAGHRNAPEAYDRGGHYGAASRSARGIAVNTAF